MDQSAPELTQSIGDSEATLPMPLKQDTTSASVRVSNVPSERNVTEQDEKTLQDKARELEKSRCHLRSSLSHFTCNRVALPRLVMPRRHQSSGATPLQVKWIILDLGAT